MTGEPLPVKPEREAAGNAKQLRGGRWVPAIPVRGPIDTRWLCSHRWTPHVHENGMTSWVDYDCLNCGDGCEAGVPPDDGPYRLRYWIARKLRWPWVIAS